MTDHLWTQENLDAYLANGLGADERFDLERHVADCAECTQLLQAARQLETTMKSLFADAPPPAGLTDRAIARLRREPIAYPRWVRYAMGAAAVLVLGLIGAGVQAVVKGDGIDETRKNLEEALKSTRSVKGTTRQSGFVNVAGVAEDGDPGAKSAAVKNAEAEVIRWKAEVDRADDLLRKGVFDKQTRDETVKEWKSSLAKLDDAKVKVEIENGRAGATTWILDASDSMIAQPTPSNAIIDLSDAAATITETTKSEKKIAEAGYDQKKDEVESLYLAKPESAPLDGRSGANPKYALRLKPRGGEAGDILVAAGESKGKLDKAALDLDVNKKPPSVSIGSPEYFNPGGHTAEKPTDSIRTLSIAEANLKNIDIFATKEPDKKRTEFAAKLEAPKAGQPPIYGPPPPPVPEPAGRKIIRTGDMEFEVESFDSAVAGIGKLLGAVKGGFIATVNSDKLPNGKMKGAVVVRMPPQFLDKFLFDVRGSLGKNSELKHQRVGSADITKQFTDIESRLRAARAMEERIIKIIQTGKGEVKDLIAAERELGIWRTKIEEMEGEIRYYGNQIALSTLTINLTEREISTPFALVTSEKVQMRLEVEEVGKALEAALKAVDQFKGRVVKSESKQFKAGQVEATLLAEIPPQAKESFRAALRRLGIVSEDESAQKTQSEGGSGNPGKLEPKILDVVFEVTLNNIVNIKPRNSVNLDIASNDVAAAYARLEAFVLKKGQMRVSTKSEPDKQRVTAYLEFDVPNEHKEEADKLIAAVGPVLKQTNVQLPITEVATSQKFGYKLSLFSVATVPPREIVKLRLEVDNVKVRAAEIEGLARLNKGQVERGRFLQSPQGTTTTVVALRVPMSAADALVGQFVKMSKEVIENEETPNPNAPENDLATTVVVVTLTGGNPIVPKDQDLGAQVSKGLYWAFWMFCMCMIFIVSGLAFVVPIAVVIWAGVRIGTWMWGGSKASAAVVKPVAPKPEEQKPAGNA